MDLQQLHQNAVEQYADMVIRIAYHHVKNQTDAEDIAQDVFLKLITQSGFNNDGHVKAWLIQVTINRCKDFNKSFWQRNRMQSPKDWPALDDEQRSIMDEVWELPPDYRTIIYLHFYEGYTIKEMAAILKKNENTIGSQLGRAKKKLKTILLEGGDYHAYEQV